MKPMLYLIHTSCRSELCKYKLSRFRQCWPVDRQHLNTAMIVANNCSFFSNIQCGVFLQFDHILTLACRLRLCAHISHIQWTFLSPAENQQQMKPMLYQIHTSCRSESSKYKLGRFRQCQLVDRQHQNIAMIVAPLVTTVVYISNCQCGVFL